LQRNGLFAEMKNRISYIAAVVFAAFSVSAADPDDTPQSAYIRKYAPTAVSEMYRSGVPASITLAQGLLESRYGQSALATGGNNHFGIKCHDWTGKKMYHDDDRKGECFRVYSSAEESFRDHSDFLRYRDRYKSLFDNDVTDYKAWAYGLKKAGYATDPAYPSKLIKLIEDYSLSDYDRMKPEDFAGDSSAGSADRQTNALSSREKRKAARKTAKKSVKSQSSAVAGQRSGQAVMPEEQIPAPPLAIEEPQKVTAKEASETFSFALKRQLYSKNGVKFIYSEEGETYSSIAEDYRLFRKEILRFNDAVSDTRLQPGTVVYLQAKKSHTGAGLDKYISDEGGESMRELSQRFAVKLKDLCSMNGLGQNYVTSAGDEIILRQTKK
jgi:hypothetical protein